MSSHCIAWWGKRNAQYIRGWQSDKDCNIDLPHRLLSRQILEPGGLHIYVSWIHGVGQWQEATVL